MVNGDIPPSLMVLFCLRFLHNINVKEYEKKVLVQNTTTSYREKTIPSDQALLGEGVGLTHPPRPADEPG